MFYSGSIISGVPDGPIKSRVNFDVVVVGSNLTGDSFLQVDKPRA